VTQHCDSALSTPLSEAKSAPVAERRHNLAQRFSAGKAKAGEIESASADDTNSEHTLKYRCVSKIGWNCR
jgi:hypothetical protein